jgi:hypothetical protein
MGVVGGVQQGQAAKKQSAYAAGVQRNNAILAERAAVDAKARGTEAEARERIKTRQLIGRQKVQLAANGILVGEGSALDLVSDTAALGELDALTIRSNAEREALGFRQRAAGFESDATMSELAGSAKSKAAYGEAATTALAGGGKVAKEWDVYKKETGKTPFSGWY